MKTPAGTGGPPPVPGERILRLILPADEAESLAGDLRVLYRKKVRRHGRVFARAWAWLQILRAGWNAASISAYWGVYMFKNHLKIAFRHLLKNKAYSGINIAGLAIGMACCLLLLLWIQDELGFDRFHGNADSLYRVLYQSGGGRHSPTCAPLAPAVEAEIPEVRAATRYRPIGGRLIKYGDRAFHGDRFSLADPQFFEMFSFPFLKGDASRALDNPFAMVLTEKTAEKIFGAENPLGKILRVENRFDFQVTGVLQDLPADSHIRFDVLARFDFLSSLWGEDLNSWGSNSHLTYVWLREGSDPAQVQEKITSIYHRNLTRPEAELVLYPVTDIHLAPFATWVDTPPGSRTHVILFSIIAGFILLIACINFINLTTARSLQRAKEVGVRKTVGALRMNLIRQFYGESILSAGLAFLLALALVLLLLPTLNALSGKELTANVLGDARILGGMASLAFITVLLSGSYPALFIASFKPARVLASVRSPGSAGRAKMRKILVILQFTITIFLIVGTFIIAGQLQFIHRQDLGFDRDNIITMPVTASLLRQISAAGREILNNPDIESLTLSNTVPGELETTTSQIGWEGKDPERKVRMEVLWVDLEFLETFGLEMAEGRFFSRSHVSELRDGIIVNQAAVKAMGIRGESPIGKRLTNSPSLSSSQGPEAVIIGVVKDFNSRPLHDPIAPLVMRFANRTQDNLSLRIRAGTVPQTLEFLRGIWARVAPDYGFEYRFFDEVLAGLYNSEARMERLFRLFAFLAVFVSCLGLFGLAAFSAEQKTKEIGIRKVFGAGEAGIVWRQSRDFVLLVAAAGLIACPAAYLAGRRWLEGFTYRMSLRPWIFLSAGAIAMAVALVSVSLQVWKAARANPVDSLRYE